jgi:hypothetical protein
MKTNRIRTFAIAALASTALAGVVFGPTLAAAATEQAAAAASSAKNPLDIKLSEDGYRAMRDIRAARISIFNGNPGEATTYVDKAETALGKAKADEKRLVAKEGDNAETKYVPVDGQIVVADDYVASPEKAKHIAAGNAHLQKGKTKEALEELRLAAVDIGFSRVLMPLPSTAADVRSAASLLRDGKFYEANMALKAAEDGMTVDTVMLVETPKADHASVDETKADAGKTASAQTPTTPTASTTQAPTPRAAPASKDAPTLPQGVTTAK